MNDENPQTHTPAPPAETVPDPQATHEPDPDPSATGGTPEPTDARVAELSREAASWRKKLRDAEQVIEGKDSRLAGYEKADVERLAAARMNDPNDLWLSTSLDEMRDDDGSIDEAKIAAEIERVLAEKPHWRKQPDANLHQGNVGETVDPPGPSFGQVLKRTPRND